jgi:hypothetical protein
MAARETWSYEYDPESKMYNLWWDDDDRGAIGEVYTEAYAKMIVSDHNKSLSPSRELEVLDEAKALLIELRSYAASLEGFCVVHHWEPNAALGDKLTAFLAKLTPKTEEVEKP